MGADHREVVSHEGLAWKQPQPQLRVFEGTMWARQHRQTGGALAGLVQGGQLLRGWGWA